MGGTSYSSVNATHSRSMKGTMRNSLDENFMQNVERKAHAEMKSQGITLREARDSEVHPATFPIIIALDLTGSMMDIPQNLIKTGLPTIVSESIQGGVQSPAILFLGIGDHECDSEPLQIGQFESGDEELDLWLGRVYLEQGGGGNEGESYGLAHYFATEHCVTDHFEKGRGKGLLITIGDEPSLTRYPDRAMVEIMGNKNLKGFTDVEILKEAQEKWDVFHINPRDNGETRSRWRDARGYWMKFLGQNYIGTNDYRNIPKLITDLIVKHGTSVSEGNTSEDNAMSDSKDEDIY